MHCLQNQPVAEVRSISALTADKILTKAVILRIKVVTYTAGKFIDLTEPYLLLRIVIFAGNFKGKVKD